MPLRFDIEVVLPPGLQNLVDTDLIAALHETAPTIGNTINEAIRNRSPMSTGALISSETFKTPDKGKVVVSFYPEDGPQIDAWGRVYAPYAEGPPIGLSTYTNPPRSMYAKVETEDSPVIQAWAEATLENKLNAVT